MLYFQTLFLSILASILKFLSRTFKFGAGTSISGLLVEKYFPSVLQYFNKKYKKIIYISGTNGKTTTTTTLFQILKNNGLKVNSNIGGANIFRGIAGQILQDFSLFGGVKNNILLIECEEATLPKLCKYLQPTHLVLLNIFRDQLDVYGELDVTLKYFQKAISEANGAKIIINEGDKFLLKSLEKSTNEVIYFDVEGGENLLYEEEILNNKNEEKIGKKWIIQKQDFGFEIFEKTQENSGKIAINFDSTNYNLYNYGAAVIVGLDLGLKREKIAKSFTKMKGAFGRGEKINLNGKKIELHLVKNPAGAYSCINDVLKNNEEKFDLVFGINDKTADGKDVSWLWDIPLEKLDPKKWENVGKIWVLGTRKFDIALRLKHAGLEEKIDLENNIEKFLKETENNTKFLLTYTALREIRRKIGEKINLKNIDEV